MGFNFEDEFVGSCDAASFMIDGVKYKLRAFFSSDEDAHLVSLDATVLPLETVRYIGGIPWKVNAVVREFSPFVSLFLGYGFRSLYRTAWTQIYKPKISVEFFKKLILRRILEKL